MKYINPLTCIDFYKADHRRQYPSGTELVVSNLTPRSGKHANVGNKEGIIFFGLQYFIQNFLGEIFDKGFFQVEKQVAISEYKRRMDTSLGEGAIPVDHIADLHDLGWLPIEIKAVKEGTFVPVGVPCLTIHNTLPQHFWLTNYLETILSTYLWAPCTSATTAHSYKKLFLEHAEKTGGPKEFTNFQGHDFSFRGLSSLQTAVMSGAAHLLSFYGTDTVPAIDFLEQYYGANSNNEMIGCSVPATEHSVMCMDGMDGELATFRRLITQLYPKGIVSIVSDTWDFWQVLTDYAVVLKDEIMKRDGKVVFRPDSGDPVEIICGNDKRYGMATPQGKGAVEVLWEIFGGKVNEKGFKELDPHVGLIYGDSINYNMAKEILERLEAKGFASTNIVFGVGSYTYQYVTRDTWGMAVKATFGRVNGQDREIFKRPKTDNGDKYSAKGLVMVQSLDGKLCLNQQVTWEEFNDSKHNELRTVYKDGQIVRTQSLNDIRKLMVQ